MGLCDTNRSSNRPKTTSLYNNQQKNRTWKMIDFAVQAGQKIKLKENEKIYKYLDLAREWKREWNMKVTTVPKDY